MNDVKDLLGLALDNAPGEGTQADPRGDLARGRRLLRRRRMLGAAGVAGAMALGAVLPLVLQGGTPGGHPSAALGRSHPATSVKASSSPAASAGHGPVSSHSQVKLVAWTGKQPPGFLVSSVPSGWVLQGNSPWTFTVAPAGDPDTNQYSFIGKLVVMLQSSSVTSPPTGQSQPVDGRRGVFQPACASCDGIESLTYLAANGKWVVIQAPTTLGWDGAQLAKFAGGVTVLATAQQGVG